MSHQARHAFCASAALFLTATASGCLFHGQDAVSQSSLPEPFLCMYGHRDIYTEEFKKHLSSFTVIEGSTTDATFVKALRARGRIYAYGVPNPLDATASDLVAEWSAPFENDMNGLLPGGFDAIAIDEITAAPDGSPSSQAQCAALATLRLRYPQKLIFAAALGELADGGSSSVYPPHESYKDLLNAMYKHADMIMLERYSNERTPRYGLFEKFSDNIESQVPGILRKTVFGLIISQNGLVADDSTDVGFWGHLDEQLHIIRNDADCAIMPGIMFWVYYRSESAITPAFCAKLVDHYFIDDRTVYFGDGDLGQLIDNSQFENGTQPWRIAVGAGGEVGRFEYDEEGLPDHHDDYGSALHGSFGLKMTRGDAPNQAICLVNCVEEGTTYTVSAFALAESAESSIPTAVRVLIRDSDGQIIASESMRINEKTWRRLIFSFCPPSAPVSIVLTDSGGAPGQVTFWDFVELEAAY